jgi:hypothetical protein
MHSCHPHTEPRGTLKHAATQAKTGDRMDTLLQIGGSFAAALVCLLALLIVFLIGTLGLQYLRMRKARPRDKTNRDEADIRSQLLDQGYSPQEVDDAITETHLRKEP